MCLGEEDEKKAQYCYERFVKAGLEILSLRKRNSFVIVSLRYNRFEFSLEVDYLKLHNAV